MITMIYDFLMTKHTHTPGRAVYACVCPEAIRKAITEHTYRNTKYQTSKRMYTENHTFSSLREEATLFFFSLYKRIVFDASSLQETQTRRRSRYTKKEKYCLSSSGLSFWTPTIQQPTYIRNTVIRISLSLLMHDFTKSSTLEANIISS